MCDGCGNTNEILDHLRFASRVRWKFGVDSEELLDHCAQVGRIAWELTCYNVFRITHSEPNGDWKVGGYP